MITRQFIICTTALCFSAAMIGCSRSPQVSFYTLGGAAGGATVNPSKSAPTVTVANLTLPDLVDRPQLVERVSGNRVEILETHRWAEPLKNSILHLLTENLANQLGSNLVTAYPQNPTSEPDYKVAVDILRFESMGNTVSVDATWSIRRTQAGTAKTGRSQPRESRGKEGYEALAAAYNRAIVSVSNDIAETIRTDWGAGR